MNYNNYSLSSSKGKLYLKSKTPTEGYEEVKYGTDGRSVTYHKYFDSIKGLPTYLEQKEFQHEGRTLKFLELTLVDGDDVNKVSVPLKNKGGYTDEVKALISALNGLELGEEVTLNPSLNKYTNSKGVDKTQLQLYVNYTGRQGENGKNLSTGYIAFTDIPKPTSKIVAGDTTWDWTEQTEFYWGKLTEIEARFKNQTTSSSTQAPRTATTAPPDEEVDPHLGTTPKNPKPSGKQIPTASPEQAFEPATNVKENKHDDLPF